MRRDKKASILDYIIKHSKIVFPIIVIAVVAAAVSVGLSANRANAEQGEKEDNSSASGIEAGVSGGIIEPATVNPLPSVEPGTENVPLLPNENDGVRAIVLAYYNAMAAGDEETLRSIFDSISENELLRYVETSKYVDYLPAVEIYTKEGLSAGDVIAYVYYKLCFVNHPEEFPGYEVFYICEDGQGGYYIKNQNNFTEEESSYVERVSLQADAVEFNNRITTEYNDMMEQDASLLQYLGELGLQVDVAIGVILAEQNATVEPDVPQQGAETPDSNEPSQQEPAPPAVDEGPQYASATTTVNVRSSDSEQADKLGQVTGGTRVQVQAVQLNGWTKIVYEGKDGFIKSEYLKMEESVSGLQVIGTVTAKENINVRTTGSTQSESLGILAGGESADLFANEGEWCKINYKNRVAYVKSEYVTINQ